MLLWNIKLTQCKWTNVYEHIFQFLFPSAKCKWIIFWTLYVNHTENGFVLICLYVQHYPNSSLVFFWNHHFNYFCSVFNWIFDFLLLYLEYCVFKLYFLRNKSIFNCWLIFFYRNFIRMFVFRIAQQLFFRPLLNNESTTRKCYESIHWLCSLFIFWLSDFLYYKLLLSLTAATSYYHLQNGSSFIQSCVACIKFILFFHQIKIIWESVQKIYFIFYSFS